MKKQLFKFGCVGVLATAAHLGMVASLVPIGMHPLYANIFAFLTAFVVSYLGHRFWTFGESVTPHLTSVIRFFGVALSSFALNESLYFVLLEFSSFPYLPALFLVLMIVTPITFALSRLWAFR